VKNRLSRKVGRKRRWLLKAISVVKERTSNRRVKLIWISSSQKSKSSYQQGELMEEDQKCILIIGGIEVFLPHSPVEARACVADATTEERQPTVTIIEEEKEQILMSSPTEEEEHAVKMLTPWEKELEMLEDWLNNPEPEDGLPGDCSSY
jgi:hypothetical protein